MAELELNDELKSILKSLADASEPIGGKVIEQDTGLSSSKVSSRIKKLREAGLVDSPIRCKYAITDEGKSKL